MKTWIIGASSGIGAALAKELEKRGYQVTISARNEAALKEVAGSSMDVIPVDVSSEASFRKAAAAYLKKNQEFEIVIFVSGYWKQMSIQQFDFEVYKEHDDVNNLGLARCASVVIPKMLEANKGTFIGTSSVAGYRGLPSSIGYSPSKAAQLNFLECMRVDLKGTNIKVQAISPGFVKTPMTATNKFRMPFLIEAEDAAKYIANGIKNGKPEIVFPRSMATTMKIARLIPQKIWPKLFSQR